MLRKLLVAILIIAISVSLVAVMPAQAATDAGYVWPIDAQIFGRGFSDTHKAIDIVAPAGLPVKSVNKGTVFCASMVSADANAYCYNCGFIGAGFHVAISYSNGIKTMYAHLSNVYVGQGQTVETGQSIGEVGSTGNSTGAHLHFAVFLNGFADAYAVDPLDYLTPFSNVYATDITNTSATIYGVFGAYGPTITDAGIYIGTSPSNMAKITENLNTEGYDSNGVAISSVFYNTAKWYGALQEGTTYYYRVWISRYGKEYVSDIKSFKTTGGHTHSYGSWVTSKDPTCEKIGTKIRKCSCGYIEQTIVPALGHKPIEVIAKEPQVGVEGLKEIKCNTCNEILSTEVIPALPGSVYAKGDINEDGRVDAADLAILKKILAGIM